MRSRLASLTKSDLALQQADDQGSDCTNILMSSHAFALSIGLDADPGGRPTPREGISNRRHLPIYQTQAKMAEDSE